MPTQALWVDQIQSLRDAVRMPVADPLAELFSGPHAAGRQRLQWARRPALGWLARAVHLPRRSGETEVHVSIGDDDIGQRWDYRVGRQRVVIRQWFDGVFMTRQIGPLGVTFQVVVGDDAVRLIHVGTSLVGMPVPRRWAPHVRVKAWRRWDGSVVTAFSVRDRHERLIVRGVSTMRSLVPEYRAREGASVIRLVS